MKCPVKIEISYVAFTALMALYFVTVMNLPFYIDLFHIISQLEAVDVGFVISVPVFLFAAMNLVFNLFSWPKVSKPIFIVLLLISSAVSYSTFNYGTFWDQEMVGNVMETDNAEAASYISAFSVLWIALLGVLPALLVLTVRFKKVDSVLRFLGWKLASMVASILVIAAIAALYYQDYASVGRNNNYLRKVINPYAWLNGSVKYVNARYFFEPQPYQQLGLDATQSPAALAAAQQKPTLLVFVVGETARVQNFPYYGYERPTTPFTDDLEMIRFQDVASCGTATAVSLRCMFSLMTRDNFNIPGADNQDNALDILQRAGVGVFWKENDGGDKNVAKNVPSFTVDRDREDAMCQDGSCYDEALLENFDQDIARMQGNRVLFLHLMGSHGPTYYRRYPANMKFFQPACDRADIENCSPEAIVNTYDNTIRYTDFVIRQTIDKLTTLEDRYNTALIYVSDHGESLGEGGAYLHGFPYAIAPLTQKRVPLMMWLSPGFQAAKTIDMDCLADKAATFDVYSHDYVTHSLLGLMDVQTGVYEQPLDLFASCRAVTDV